MSHKLMKVFDCQDMPDDVRKAFFNYYKGTGVGNDVYVLWFGSMSDEWEDDTVSMVLKKGYMYKDMVLRPSSVQVSHKP